MTNFRRQLLVIFVILPATVRARNECCEDDVAVQLSNVSYCENGELVEVKCDSNLSTLTNDGSKYSYSSYVLMTDNKGDTFLYAPGRDYEWHGLR